MRLVADIGGTNARIGLCENGEIVSETIHSYANDQWPHFHEMLAGYLEGHSPAQVREMVIAGWLDEIGSRNDLDLTFAEDTAHL